MNYTTPGTKLPNHATVITTTTDSAGDTYVLAVTHREYVTWHMSPETGVTMSGHYPAPGDLSPAGLQAALDNLRDRVQAFGFDPDDLFVNVIGSAFETMPWYAEVTPQRPGATIDEPDPVLVRIDYDGESTETTITPRTLAQAMVDAQRTGVSCFGTPLMPNMDWDADAADVLIQRMILGSVVFG